MQTAAGVCLALTDIDDALTSHGIMPSTTGAAISELAARRIQVIPVTGRLM